MTPQAFSFPVLSNNGYIYVPPYGLTESLDFMIKVNPCDYSVKKIKISVSDCLEKWITGVPVKNKIYFLPHNEQHVLVVDTETDSIKDLVLPDELKHLKGKYIQGHVYQDKIFCLPYGTEEMIDSIMIIDTLTDQLSFVDLHLEKNDLKKWHTSQVIDDTIYGVPRGQWSCYDSGNSEKYFSYIIHFNMRTLEYELIDKGYLWKEIDDRAHPNNKKYTTMAKYENQLWAPPYGENPDFDTMLHWDGKKWFSFSSGIKSTSRKYFTHITSKNGKIYFPPAGHEEDWSKLLIIDANTKTWRTIDLGVGKESKKYFAGGENSQEKIYFIPRGGCVCEPEESWKREGDLAEILVIDTKDDSYYTVDISEYFFDNTTIEKYNSCVIINDIIAAFPYGQSESFQTVLFFDTVSEKVIKVIDLNDV